MKLDKVIKLCRLLNNNIGDHIEFKLTFVDVNERVIYIYISVNVIVLVKR